MIDPNVYYDEKLQASSGRFKGQYRTVMWVDGDWVLYRKDLPNDDDRQEVYIMHDCSGEGDWTRSIGIHGTDLYSYGDTECRCCKREIPETIQTLYRIYGWGINKEVV